MARFEYEISASVLVDEATVAYLIRASQTHYDAHCRSVGAKSGFLRTWYGMAKHYAGDFQVETVAARFRDLDTLAKITEMARDESGVSLHLQLRSILAAINDEYHSLAEGNPVEDQELPPFDLTGHVQRVTSTPTHVSVFNHSDGLKATASADNMGSHWWIGRVLVEPENRRGEGVGGQMVRALLKAIIEQDGQEVHVAPGGYGEDPEKQFEFYRRQGFVQQEGEDEGLFVWRRSPDRAVLLALHTLHKLTDDEAF
jgi:predicted GNAT family N-acyltransferase